MTTTYPEIIREMLTKASSDQLRMFDYTSFEQAVEKIDRSMYFFSVYVVMEPLDQELRQDERFVTISESNIGSLVRERTARYWFRNSEEHFRLIDERTESLKSSSEYCNIKKWDLDAEVELKDRVLIELNNEIQPKIIELFKKEYQQLYEDEWEVHWKQVNLFEDRLRYKYLRKHNIPLPFGHWDRRNSWQQFYFARDREGHFHYQRGASNSSEQRFCHGIYGHLFAAINDEKPVPTFFFTYNSRNRFVFEREEESLWLNFLCLRTNCALTNQESRKILEYVHNVDWP